MNNTKGIYERLLDLGIRVRANARGDVKTTCPWCSQTRKNKTEPCLSVNVDKGVYNCHNCGISGTVNHEIKDYTIPVSELKKLDDKVIAWFNSRGISNQTLLRYGVTQSEERGRNWINFNYYENGKLINIKYRDSQKNFRLVGGARLILYGIDVANDDPGGRVVITEGEMDTLSLYEAGIRCGVSVPNGASKGNQKLEWLEESMEFLGDKDIILAGDNDEPGIGLREEIARRLGRSRCSIVEWGDCKDANEYLIKYGKDKLREAVDNAVPYPVEGIEDAKTSWDGIVELYDNGPPETYELGWELDRDFKFSDGLVTVITGVPGSGKTSWLKNVISKMSEMYDFPWFIYSSEEANTEMAIIDLMSIRTGKPFFAFPGHHRMTKEEMLENRRFVEDHFKYYSLNENDMTIDAILEKGKEMVRRFGVRGVVIDNMSTIENKFSIDGGSRHNQIGAMFGGIVKFARNHGVMVFIVAHPKKPAPGTKGYIPTGYDIGDSSHYYNKPDVGITIHRNKETRLTEVIFWKVRFRWNGTEGVVGYFKYDVASGRFVSTQNVNDGKYKTKFVSQPIDKFISAGVAGIDLPGNPWGRKVGSLDNEREGEGEVGYD